MVLGVFRLYVYPDQRRNAEALVLLVLTDCDYVGAGSKCHHAYEINMGRNRLTLKSFHSKYVSGSSATRPGR
jgi:hypothetical protein